MKLGSKLFYGTGVVTIFLVLGLAGIYNLLPKSIEEESAVVEAAAPVLLSEEKVADEVRLTAEEKLIKLQLARERAWSEKMAAWEQSGQLEKLAQDNIAYFQEKQMEILLEAKGFKESMVLITEKRINVLVPAIQASKNYQQLHDLISGNLGAAANSVYIIPIEDEI